MKDQEVMNKDELLTFYPSLERRPAPLWAVLLVLAMVLCLFFLPEIVETFNGNKNGEAQMTEQG